MRRSGAGFLFLVTGLRTGEVGSVVELLGESAPLDDGWVDIVGVSFRAAGRAALVAWGEQWSLPLDLAEVAYRVRCCGAGMDEARDQTRMDGDAELDRYLLQFWPAPARPDRVVKQTGATVAYWHPSTRHYPTARVHDENAAIAVSCRGTRCHLATCA